MEAKNDKTNSKFTFRAEVLPANKNTEKILKIREEKANKDKAIEDAVSIFNFKPTQFVCNSCSLKRFYFFAETTES